MDQFAAHVSRCPLSTHRFPAGSGGARFLREELRGHDIRQPEYVEGKVGAWDLGGYATFEPVKTCENL